MDDVFIIVAGTKVQLEMHEATASEDLIRTQVVTDLAIDH